MTIDEFDEEKFKRVICETLALESESLWDSMTFEELGADSLDLCELIGNLETEFNVQFHDEAFDDVRTIADARRALKDVLE